MAANLQMRGFFTGVVREVNKIICGNLRDPTSVQPYILQNSGIQGSLSLPVFTLSCEETVQMLCNLTRNYCNLTRNYMPRLVSADNMRFVHSSLYEKNEDDGAHLNRVPEDVIAPQTQKSWVPHPKTGVFGPAEENNWTGGDHHHSHEKSGDSVLEQQAWFRPLEDVQKQPSN